jgi:hypothetical protein
MTHAAAALCLALLSPQTPPPSDAELEARYQDAVIALQESHPEVAFGLFEWVLATVSPAHVLRPLAEYGAARAAIASTTPGHACPGEAHVRAYLSRADADPSKRERLSRALPDLEARCAAERPAPVAVVPAPAPASEAPAPASASAALDARLAAPVVAPAEPDDTGGTLRRAGWLSLAAGAALTAAGGYFWYAASRAQDDAAAATTIARHTERADALETANGWALGLTIAGGLGLVGGSGLLLFGGTK